MLMTDNDKKDWISCVEENPNSDGIYYIFISNIQTGNEIRKSSFRNGEWDCFLEKEEIIIAWKNIKNETIQNEYEWLDDHKKEIKQNFKLSEVDLSHFAIAETLTECFYEYESWFHYNLIHMIDGVYVIKVVF